MSSRLFKCQAHHSNAHARCCMIRLARILQACDILCASSLHPQQQYYHAALIKRCEPTCGGPFASTAPQASAENCWLGLVRRSFEWSYWEYCDAAERLLRLPVVSCPNGHSNCGCTPHGKDICDLCLGTRAASKNAAHLFCHRLGSIEPDAHVYPSGPYGHAHNSRRGRMPGRLACSG